MQYKDQEIDPLALNNVKKEKQRRKFRRRWFSKETTENVVTTEIFRLVKFTEIIIVRNLNKDRPERIR